MNAAKAYVAQYDSYKAQLARVHRGDTHEESWEERSAARRWRFDPLRSLDSNLMAVACVPIDHGHHFVDFGQFLR